VKSDFHPITERLLRDLAESLQAHINSLARQADDETCLGSRQGIMDEILALREDKKEICLLLT
jgi:hypothetical protein